MIPGTLGQKRRIPPPFLVRLDAVVLLGAVVLGMISSLLLPKPALTVMGILLMGVMVWTGSRPGDLFRVLRSWAPVIGIVLAIHVLTTTASAPLGHPSWGGLRAGIWALVRIGLSLAWLVLFSRLKSLDELVGAVRWWLRPLGALGLPTGQLALVLAVALGTVPGVMNEGRRAAAVLRMRRATVGGARVSRWRRFQDRIAVVVPLLEGMVRRAEVLSLSLRSRQPATGPLSFRPGFWPLAGLVLWTLGLLYLMGMGAGS